MKNLKKISLISFLACATLVGGILAANTEVETPVQEQKFWMETGAQIRVPNAVEAGQEDFDGIRFIAKMTDAYRVAKGDLDKMSVGMFFLPADKVDTINEAAVFGENATYYWKDCGYEKGDRLEIVHKETYAFEETPGDDFLTIKCSLWNLLPETLDREIGAVAYLRVNKGTDENPEYEYHFAETAQGARAVSVAQKALLNEKDAIHTVEGGADRVNEAYVNAYLKGGSVEMSYTEHLYVENADGTYEKKDSVKTVEVSSYNTTTLSEVPEGYVWANGLAPAKVLLFSGETTEVDVYANIPAKQSLVLFDGTDSIRPLPDKTYLPAGTDFALGDTTVNGYKTPWDSVFEGEYGWIYNQANNSWGGPAWTTALQLPFATNTFSYVARFAADTTKHGDCYIYSKWNSAYQLANSIKARAIGEADWTTFELNAGYVIFTEEFPCFKAGVTYEFEVTVSNAITTFGGIFWKINPGEAGVLNNFAIDNVCMVDTRKPELASARISVPYTYTGSDGISFTPWTYNIVDDNKTPISLNAAFKVAGASEWSTIIPNGDGVCSIPTTSGNLYQVKLTHADYGFEEILEIREGKLMTNFNGDADDDVITVTTSGAYKVENEFSGVGAIVDGCSGMALKLATNGYIQRKHNSAFNLGGKTITKIGFYAYANGGESFKEFLYPYNPSAYYVAEANYTCDGVAATTFSAGWHYYEADVTDTAAWTHIWFAARPTVYIDAMLFIF